MHRGRGVVRHRAFCCQDARSARSGTRSRASHAPSGRRCAALAPAAAAGCARARTALPPLAWWRAARLNGAVCLRPAPNRRAGAIAPPSRFPPPGGQRGLRQSLRRDGGFWLGAAAPNALARPRGMHTKHEFCITRSTLRRQAPCLNSTGLALRVTRPTRRFCRALRVSPATFCGGAGWCSQACAPQKAGPTTRFGYKI